MYNVLETERKAIAASTAQMAMRLFPESLLPVDKLHFDRYRPTIPVKYAHTVRPIGFETGLLMLQKHMLNNFFYSK